ncbi:hypothetical protein FRC06_002533 [Ceratobasidium sp. 370]|nr:hypothetical protein FRC06_002533 [Ceratobasidium sp. 370]
MADAQPVRVLPAAKVEALLTKLVALCSTLPDLLPVVELSQSKYGCFVGFVPDPELVEARGQVGAMNTALEHAFGHCQDGLQIVERGKGIESIVPLLEKFLKRHPGDIILQKWLLDFVSVACELCPKRTIKQTEKAHKGDLKRKAPDMSDTSISVTEIDVLSESEHLLDDFEEPSPNTLVAPQPASALSKHTTKKVKKAGPSPDTIPPQGPTLLRQEACPATKPARRRSPQPTCQSSSPCATSLWPTPNDRWIESSAMLFDAAGYRAAGSGLQGNNLQGGSDLLGDNVDLPPPGTGASLVAGTPIQATKRAKSFFAPFNNQGKLDNAACINLTIVRLLCAAGVPPSIADSHYWKALFQAINPRLSDYAPPSSTTLRDSLIPAEARQAVLSARRFLQTQRNLSISFDGLTRGDQPVYTSHVSTSDRQSFLMHGDVYYGSHNSAYMTCLLDEVVREIGAHRFISVVSDDTNATKKARRDFVEMYLTIINLADPCHKLNLVVQNICSDIMFIDTINTPPDDVYILSSFGDPRMQGMRIYRNSNPLVPSIILPTLRGAPRPAHASPNNYISDSTWTRIRKAALGLLKTELTLAETTPNHPLSKYLDAQQAKNKLDARLIQYACNAYPFDQPLGQQTVLEYWSEYMSRPDTKVLGFIFTKLFSATLNSMNDERTGSRMTFLYSKLRSHTDINTMVEQIQVKQWYQLMDEYVGNVKQQEKR